MPEWNDARFQQLLTPNIFKNDSETVKEKIHLKHWDNLKYAHLLRPSIFNITVEQIDRNIKIFEKYYIDDYITVSSLRINSKLLEALIKYILNNGISLVIDGRLNPILSSSKKRLRETYGIDIQKLVKKKI